jgi:hypothetical protein
MPDGTARQVAPEAREARISDDDVTRSDRPLKPRIRRAEDRDHAGTHGGSNVHGARVIGDQNVASFQEGRELLQ